ncbi:hypothetical protein LPUS_09214 [Lasallia pustulata]|uniref:Uncharacterized protein n=1 Tax=Lasallia pustulata TaxID=136370 RepID=A0A1W5D6T7_9LECA|nr:hypothetical protein LPUS_09214 [Lasallia pustulata]
MVNGTKNVVAWGFLRGFIPWTTRSGYAVVFGAMTGIWFGLLLLAVPLYIFGARMRTYTAKNFRIIFW